MDSHGFADLPVLHLGHLKMPSLYCVEKSIVEGLLCSRPRELFVYHTGVGHFPIRPILF